MSLSLVSCFIDICYNFILVKRAVLSIIFTISLLKYAFQYDFAHYVFFFLQ